MEEIRLSMLVQQAANVSAPQLAAFVEMDQLWLGHPAALFVRGNVFVDADALGYSHQGGMHGGLHRPARRRNATWITMAQCDLVLTVHERAPYQGNLNSAVQLLRNTPALRDFWRDSVIPRTRNLAARECKGGQNQDATMAALGMARGRLLPGSSRVHAPSGLRACALSYPETVGTPILGEKVHASSEKVHASSEKLTAKVLPGGYDCIVRGLSRGVEVRTGRAGEVERLRYGEARGVEAHLADGSVVRADRAIVTLPLGVLRVGIEAQAVTGTANSSSKSSPSSSSSSAWPRGAVRFEPPLPPRWLLPLSKLGWGEALKVGLRFPYIYWAPTAHFLGKVGGGCTAYGSSRHMEFVNLAVYTGAPVLLMETERAWARTLAAMPDEQLLGVVMGELRRMYPGAPTPTATVVARLGENVFQRGAFTFMPPRETSELQRRLWQPLAAGRVFLAGEHTSVLHAGTVHGAVVSGRQAAAQVRAAMRGEPVVAAAERFHEQYRERLYRANYGDDDEDERWFFWGGLGGRGGQDAASEGDDDDPEEEVWDRNP